MGQANGVAGAVAATAKVSHVTCGRQSLRSLSPVPSEALLDATDAHGAARRQAEHRALRAGGSAAENPLETRVSLVPPTTRLCQITAGSKRCVPPLDFVVRGKKASESETKAKRPTRETKHRTRRDDTSHDGGRDTTTVRWPVPRPRRWRCAAGSRPRRRPGPSSDAHLAHCQWRQLRCTPNTERRTRAMAHTNRHAHTAPQSADRTTTSTASPAQQHRHETKRTSKAFPSTQINLAPSHTDPERMILPCPL